MKNKWIYEINIGQGLIKNSEKKEEEKEEVKEKGEEKTEKYFSRKEEKN